MGGPAERPQSRGTEGRAGRDGPRQGHRKGLGAGKMLDAKNTPLKRQEEACLAWVISAERERKVCVRHGLGGGYMNIDEALSLAKAGEAVLFTGAGFSYQAKSHRAPPDDEIPNARQFAKRLTRDVGHQGEYDLPMIAQYYIEEKGQMALVDSLIKNFTPRYLEQYHIDIAALPWRRVYTTNYDTVFELAAERSGKSWESVDLNSTPSSRSNLCVHVNGHIHDLNINNIEDRIKLTHSSYSAENFALSPWAQQLRQDLLSARAVVFIGYSLSDLDIARILHQNPDLVRKTVFITSPSADIISSSQLRKYGEVFSIGVEKAAQMLAEIQAPAEELKYTYTWLAEYENNTPSPPSDKASIALLTLGDAKADYVNFSLSSSSVVYCIDRQVGRQILDEVDRGRRWFLIHSDLGNGKTVLKYQLSQRLADRGYRVFWDTSFDLNRASDLARLGKEDAKVAIFVDETPDRFEVIDGLLTANHPHILVFVCVRSTLFELGEALYEKALPIDYIPIDANGLNDEEVAGFSQLLKDLGLWGSKALLSDQEKENFIKVECNRSISKLIVSVFEDSEVGRRLSETAGKLLNDRSDLASVIVASFLVNRIGHLPTPTLLSDVTNLDCWALAKTKKFLEAGEFVRFSNGVIGARSSIISTYLLRHALKAENLVWHIEKIVRNLAGSPRSKALHHIFIELQRFPVMENIIDHADKRQIIIGYFESIKTIPYNNRRALFWLHYAMARLSYGEFTESSYYFEQAKAFAKGKPKEIADINNHYARLLLDSRTKGEDYNDYWDAFSAAHTILLDQMNRGGNKHFPYRQAKNYTSFIAYRRHKLSAHQISLFVSSCRQVISAIDNLTGSIKHSIEVQQCRESMHRAIELAQMGDEERGDVRS
jgi:hypothetical protein